MAKYFNENESELKEEYGEQIELQEQTQLPVRRPSQQQSNVTTFTKDVNKDAESTIYSGSSTALLGDITAELKDLIPGSRRQIALSEINSLLDTPQDVLELVGFNERLIRDVRTFKAMSDPIAKANVRIAGKIQRLDEQHDLETDPEKKREIKELMDVKKRNLKSLQSEEYETQFQRIKRRITNVFKNPDSELTLKDRLKEVYKFEGLTLAFVIAAITMFFTTLGLTISNALKGSSGGSKPDPKPGPKPKPSIPDRVKEGLKKFAEWLKYLAGKSAAALPGIIGSIVSFLLKTIGSVVGFMAEHIIIFIIIVVSSIIYGLIEGVKEIKKSRN